MKNSVVVQKQKKEEAKKRSGFTMVELLFVMIILGLLAAIAIPQLTSGKDSAIITSMRSDAKNLVSSIQSYAVQEGEDVDYSKLAVDNVEDTDNNGFADMADDYPIKNVAESKGNQITIKGGTCPSGTANAGDPGYAIYVTNPKVNKQVYYNSCDSGKIVTEDSGTTHDTDPS